MPLQLALRFPFHPGLGYNRGFMAEEIYLWRKAPVAVAGGIASEIGNVGTAVTAAAAATAAASARPAVRVTVLVSLPT